MQCNISLTKQPGLEFPVQWSGLSIAGKKDVVELLQHSKTPCSYQALNVLHVLKSQQAD